MNMTFVQGKYQKGGWASVISLTAVQLKVELKLENLNTVLDQAKGQISRRKLFVVLE